MSADQPQNEPAAEATPASRPLPPAAPPAREVKSAGLALLLSLFPGIGQVYNGQPAKALVFFAGFVFSIWACATIHPLPFAFLIPFIYFYNLVDAYRSAALINARAAGGAPPEEDTVESPAWGATLIVLGVVFLLNNLGWLHLAALHRFWPLLLVVIGAVFLYGSLQKRANGAR